MSKRTLSESSTGSEGESESHRGVNGAPYFKIPRQDNSAPTSPVFRPRNTADFSQEYCDINSSRQVGPSFSQAPKHERRESQASTTSTTTSRSSMSETEEDYADAQKLSTVITYF